jgi:uncharacterized protein (DUF362 family)
MSLEMPGSRKQTAAHEEPGRNRDQGGLATDAGKVGRRQLLLQWGPIALTGLVLGGAGKLLRDRPGRHQPADSSGLPGRRDWRAAPGAPGVIALAGGSGPEGNLRRALAALGGIEAHVAKGHRVVIKPNCAWDRTPEQAANTNPELVAELVRLCLAAGAVSVVVADSTCHDPDRTFARSGIADAARRAGARIAHQTQGGTVTVYLGGVELGSWQILEAIAAADRVINVPIVKHHSLARGTLGMKNWFGALVGQRSRLHQRLAQVSAELADALKPTLTVVDATRVLMAGGPTGGSLSLVRELDLIAVSTDPVAADSWGGELMDLGARDLPHLDIARRLGLGTPDWRSVSIEA